jgi:hypothetical protein
MNTTLERQMVAVKTKIEETETKLDALKAERDKLEEQILEQWMPNGLNQVKIDGRTVYLRTDRYAKVEDRAAAIRLLKRSRHGRNIVQEGYNHNTLSAVVRQLIDERGELPAAWKGVIGVSEVHRIGVRNS